jgi:hypothetical protein
MKELVSIEEEKLHRLYKQLYIAQAMLEKLIDPEGLGHAVRNGDTRTVFHEIKHCLDRLEELK